VHFQFLVGHLGAAAAEHLQMQGGFEVIQMEFDFPAAGVEGGQHFQGPAERIGQRRDEEDLLGATVGGGEAEADQAQEGKAALRFLVLGLGV
jgi:hypothetical protein